MSKLKDISDGKEMRYEFPECGSNEEPKIISRFTPPIYQCIKCHKKGDRKDFIKKEEKIPQFTPLPKHP
ncbi:MAG: hypothetical protein EU532_14940 [Promethearchaeota archaeon]|nr:MAG: hypothetical protein EU532_14940 [Candidatus Lokiarchaeota archaeon]